MTIQPDSAALITSLAPLLRDKRLACSPILRGVPPDEYLRPFLDNSQESSIFEGGMKEYQALASISPNLLQWPLTATHMQVMKAMHAEKTTRRSKYLSLPQDTLVSIIMPTRNRIDAIEGAVLSVLIQSYANLELIIVDDAGEPGLETLLEGLNDSRIRYIRLETQVGAAQARNVGLKAAKGAYIGYLDDDDQWDPDFLLVSYGELLNQKRRFAYSAQIVWQSFDPESNIGQRFLALRYVPFNRSLIENRNFISMFSCLHDKRLYDEAGGFEPGLKNGQDWEFFLRLTEIADPVQIPCILSHYYMFRFTQSVVSSLSPRLMAFRTNALLRARSRWKEQLHAGGNRRFEVYSLSEAALRHREGCRRMLQSGVVKTIILPASTPENLERCLQSVWEHTPLPHEVHIVSSPPGETEKQSIQTAQTFAATDPIVTGSLSEALNRCIESSGIGDEGFVALVSGDALVTPGWLEELINVFSRFPDAGLAVPRCVLPPLSVAIETYAPQMFASFECDIALANHNIIRPNIDFEGYFELGSLQGFSALLLPVALLAKMRNTLVQNPDEAARQELCRMVRKDCDKKVYYTPFSKLYSIPGPTSVGT